MFFKKKEKKEKVEKPKKKFKIFYIFRVLFVIFIIVVGYIVFNFVKLFSRESIQVYEVNTGEIVNVDRHKGMIYRDEAVARANRPGYINFYVANRAKVSRGSFIYTINDTPSKVDTFDLKSDDIASIRKNVKMYANNIDNINFSNVYTYKQNINSLIDEINVVKQLENIDIEKEIRAKEKGFAKYAGIVSLVVDGFEEQDILDFNDDLIRNYSPSNDMKEDKVVKGNDKIYKIVKNPEFSIAFDSDYDYDNLKNKNIKVKFGYDDIVADARIESFISNDGNKHFKINIVDFPEKFIDKRVVEFEIENKKISGYKVPVKSLVSKNCYMIPKNMLEVDDDTKENVFYKITKEGTIEKVTCNISKEDEKNYYISINDSLSMLKYGDVLTNKYHDNYSLSEVVKLDGVYNINKGYAVFKNVDVVDKTNEYAIIKKGTINGITLYDHIVLDATDVVEGDLIS